MASKHLAFGQPGATVRVTAEGSAASHFRSRRQSVVVRRGFDEVGAGERRDLAPAGLRRSEVSESGNCDWQEPRRRWSRAFDQDDPKTTSAGRVLPIPDALLRTRRRQDAPGVSFTLRVFAGEL